MLSQNSPVSFISPGTVLCPEKVRRPCKKWVYKLTKHFFQNLTKPTSRECTSKICTEEYEFHWLNENTCNASVVCTSLGELPCGCHGVDLAIGQDSERACKSSFVLIYEYKHISPKNQLFHSVPNQRNQTWHSQSRRFHLNEALVPQRTEHKPADPMPLMVQYWQYPRLWIWRSGQCKHSRPHSYFGKIISWTNF